MSKIQSSFANPSYRLIPGGENPFPLTDWTDTFFQGREGSAWER